MDSQTGDERDALSGAIPDQMLAKVADLLANALGNGRMFEEYVGYAALLHAFCLLHSTDGIMRMSSLSAKLWHSSTNKVRLLVRCTCQTHVTHVIITNVGLGGLKVCPGITEKSSSMLYFLNPVKVCVMVKGLRRQSAFAAEIIAQGVAASQKGKVASAAAKAAEVIQQVLSWQAAARPLTEGDHRATSHAGNQG